MMYTTTSTLLSAAVLAGMTLAGPVVDLPVNDNQLLSREADASVGEDMHSHSHHNHLDFHRRNQQNARRQNPVVVVVTVTETEGVAPATAAPAVNPAPVRVAHYVQAADADPAPAPAPAASPDPAPAPAPAAPAASPAASPAGNSGSGSAPSNFIPNLDTTSDQYKAISILHHNVHRANHSAPALTWNDTLAGYAKETAESCIYGHSLAPGGGGYGQNIAAGNGPGNISATLSNGFYNAEIELFHAAIGNQWGGDSPDMADFEKWGHATQMVWKDTTSFACYTATCSPPGADALDCGPNGSYLKNVGCGNGGTPAYNTVCNYFPPGNYANKYSAVQASLNRPTVAMTGNGVVGL